MSNRLRWDLFCRVIDNYGDIGVCWRLACDLAARGRSVRLWVDDPSALTWMAPQGAPGVEVVRWTEPAPPLLPADVVVEAFGCDPPADYVARMVALKDSGRPPRWINLEYLSAEAYVERSHGLPSPQANGLVKYFFFPGFTPKTGGLLRELGLQARRAAFNSELRREWLEAVLPHDMKLRAGERVISVFCYAHADLRAALLPLLGEPARPSLLLLTPGPAQQQLLHAPLPDGVRCAALPWLNQTDFDRLLWSADLNTVRGEDSLVRAIWAGAPFIWHAYPQHDGAHGAKIEALLDALCAHANAPTAAALRSLWRGFNGLGAGPATKTGADIGATPAASPDVRAWTQALQAWRAELATQADLCSALLDFAQAPGPGGAGPAAVTAPSALPTSPSAGP